MSNLEPTPGEQPANDQAPVTPAGEQPQTDHSATLRTLDQEQLREALFGTPSASPIEPVTTPAAATPEETPPVVETPEEPEAGEQPPVVDPEAAAPKSSQRVRLTGLPETEQQQVTAALAMVKAGEATTVIEALQKLAGTSAPAAPAAQDPATPVVPAVPDPAKPTVANLEATIADLRAQRDQADDDFDKPEVRRLTALIEDTVGTLAQARVDEVNARQSAVSYETAYEAAIDAVEDKYDWASDEASPYFQILNDRVVAARARNDAAISNPRFIEAFADEVNKLVPGASAPAVKAKPEGPPVRAPKIVGSAIAPGHSPAPRPTEDQIRAELNGKSPEELAALLFQS